MTKFEFIIQASTCCRNIGENLYFPRKTILLRLTKFWSKLMSAATIPHICTVAVSIEAASQRHFSSVVHIPFPPIMTMRMLMMMMTTTSNMWSKVVLFQCMSYFIISSNSVVWLLRVAYCLVHSCSVLSSFLLLSRVTNIFIVSLTMIVNHDCSHIKVFYYHKYPSHSQLVYVVTLQESLDTGCFIHRIGYAKVHRTAMTSYVVAGIHRSCTAAFLVSRALIGIIIITTLIGTLFGHYLPVRAGLGKLNGTGTGVSTGLLVVLCFPLDWKQQRR